MCEALRRTLPVVSLLSDEDDQLEDDLVSLHLRQDDELDILDTEDFEESDVESDDLERNLKAELEETGAKVVEKTSIIVLKEEEEVPYEEEEVADEEEEVANEEEEVESELLDDDNNKQKPQFIPRRGLFYEHDNRSDPVDDEFSTNQEEDLARMEREKKKKKGKEVKWQHDKFIELEQLLSTLEEGSSSNKAKSERHTTKGRPERTRTRRRGNKGPGKELDAVGWVRSSRRGEVTTPRSGKTGGMVEGMGRGM